MISLAFNSIFWGSIGYFVALGGIISVGFIIGADQIEPYSLLLETPGILIELFILYCFYVLHPLDPNLKRAFWAYFTIFLLGLLNLFVFDIEIFGDSTSSFLFYYASLALGFLHIFFLCNGIVGIANQYRMSELGKTALYRRNLFLVSGSIAEAMRQFPLLLNAIHPLLTILYTFIFIPTALVFFVSNILILFLYHKTAVKFGQREMAL